jgi:WD40 repeat protein
MTSIFLSYARIDDEPFVKRLYEDLTAHGFDVWWDRVSMPARGLTFLHEIRNAIDARERFLLVLGPGATTSDYVIHEWKHAVTYGRAINPILRLGDFPLVPDELKLLHVEDFRDDKQYATHLENLIRQLSEPVAPMGKLIGVPTLPRHLLTRPERLQSLKDALLADLQRPVVVTGAAAHMGVHGMGGIGKSVLANMLARDTEVRRAFPNGIFWVPLGVMKAQEAESKLMQLQRNVAGVFVDNVYFDNVAQGRAKLGELLAGKAVLLILDDVWERAHAEAFDVLGARCRAVITTRDAGLVTSLGGAQHQVQLFTEIESLHLLAGATGVNPGDLPPEAKEIVHECGFLPLAVALCSGMVKRGVAWTGILQRLKQAALESIADRNSENVQHLNLWTAMKVSVDSLTPDEQRRYVELSVFPNDKTVAEAAVRTLWQHTGGLDEFACEDLLLSLGERSLIWLNTESLQPSQAPRRSVSLHALLYDFIFKLAGDTLALHNQLLDAYRQKCPQGWHTGTNDGYFFQRLVYHLAQAGRKEEMYALLFNFDWLVAKLRASDNIKLIKDYDTAMMHLPSHSDGRNEAMRLLQDALRSAFVLRSDKMQLPGQLVGRLMTYENLEIMALLEQIKTWKGAPWLRPLTLSMKQSDWPFGKEFEDNVLTGHNAQVSVVAITPDGYYAISGDYATLKIWDMETGAELHTMKGHTAIQSVAVTPDGCYAISGSEDGTIIIWDMETGAELHTLTGHSRCVTTVAVTPDGLRAISGSFDNTLKIWDIWTGAELHTMAGNTEFVTVIAVTPDGLRAISGSYDHTLKICDIETGAELHTLTGHTGSVHAVAVTPDGRHVISGSSDKTLKIWDIETGAELHTMTGHTDYVVAVAVTPDGRHVVSGSGDNSLKIWDIETGAKLQTLTGHTDSVNSVVVTSDGLRAISGSWDKTLKIWNIESGKIIASFNGESEFLKCACAIDGISIIAGEHSGRIHILRLENVVQGPPIITAWQSLAFPCPLCRTWSEIPASAIGTEIPCPHCGKSIRLNPFTINADWRPVAKAWQRGKE